MRRISRIEQDGEAKFIFSFEVEGVLCEVEDIPLSTKQLAKMLGKTPNAIQILKRKGLIPYFKMGRLNYYSFKAVRAEMTKTPIGVKVTPTEVAEMAKPKERQRRSKNDWIIKKG